MELNKMRHCRKKITAIFTATAGGKIKRQRPEGLILTLVSV
jgi:hypothetical protein